MTVEITNFDIQSIHKFAWNHPEIIAKEIFGLNLHSKQLEMIESFIRSNRVSVRSGHKTSKSYTLSFLSLFWLLFSPRGAGKVHLFANTHKQVQTILYAELQRFIWNAQKAGLKIPVDVSKNASLGITVPGSVSYIKGFSLESAESNPDAIAGASGEVLYVVDEASGLANNTYSIMNASPSSKIFMISNPLRKSGPFYDSFSNKLFTNIHISSEEVAKENICTGINIIDGSKRYKYSDGVSTSDYIKRCLEENSPTSYFYQVRILGNFCSFLSGFISSEIIELAMKREPKNNIDNNVYVGIDTAWSLKGGDPTAVVFRQGDKIISANLYQGVDGYTLAKKLKQQFDKDKSYFVAIDTTNNPAFFSILQEELFDHVENWTPISFQQRAAKISDRETGLIPTNKRAELFLRLKKWLIKEGSLKNIEPLLLEEIGAPLLEQRSGRFDLTSKSELRKKLGRSTNYSDALALSCYDYQEE